jgi:putative membrane protein
MNPLKKKSPETQEKLRTTNRRLHMANERTFLAWIRTSIGIMVLGFVVEKFAVPSQPKPGAGPEELPLGSGYLAVMGVFLLLLGAMASILATFRFIRTQRQIIADTYRPSVVRYVMVAILLASVGVLLAIYLAQRLQF